jgi:hypothetical protein
MQINDHVGMVWCWRTKKKDAISKENVTNTYFLLVGQFALSKRLMFVEIQNEISR